MHLIFFIRGEYDVVEKWKALSRFHFWIWKRRNLTTNKEEDILVQGALRPSILGAWEYIIPEDCLAEALQVLGFVTEDNIDYLDDKRLAFVRPIFSASKVPKEIIEEAKNIPASMKIKGVKRGLSNSIVKGVVLHLIGIKKDKFQECKSWGYYQEML